MSKYIDLDTMLEFKNKLIDKVQMQERNIQTRLLIKDNTSITDNVCLLKNNILENDKFFIAYGNNSHGDFLKRKNYYGHLYKYNDILHQRKKYSSKQLLFENNKLTYINFLNYLFNNILNNNEYQFEIKECVDLDLPDKYNKYKKYICLTINNLTQNDFYSNYKPLNLREFNYRFTHKGGRLKLYIVKNIYYKNESNEIIYINYNDDLYGNKKLFCEQVICVLNLWMKFEFDQENSIVKIILTSLN